jgi:hypothetical protein
MGFFGILEISWIGAKEGPLRHAVAMLDIVERVTPRDCARLKCHHGGARNVTLLHHAGPSGRDPAVLGGSSR